MAAQPVFRRNKRLVLKKMAQKQINILLAEAPFSYKGAIDSL